MVGSARGEEGGEEDEMEEEEGNRARSHLGSMLQSIDESTNAPGRAARDPTETETAARLAAIRRLWRRFTRTRKKSNGNKRFPYLFCHQFCTCVIDIHMFM